jgi:dienelactone hydrolase
LSCNEEGPGGLVWLHEHAAELGIDAARIGVMGDSAGGGLAAGTAILARARGVPLARQLLVYPMLDDRTVAPDPELVSFALWTYDGNVTGWGALLGGKRGSSDVPAEAAPARLTEFRGLAPAYIEVGELDIFRDEDIEYARQLGRAGVSAELHVHPGVPHGFDAIGAATSVAVRSRADRIRRFRDSDTAKDAARPPVVGLTRRGPDNRRDEEDPGGHLVPGERLPAVLSQRVRISSGASAQFHYSSDALAETLVGQAGYHCVLDGRMRLEHLLDLLREDFFPAGIDARRAAAEDHDRAVLLDSR